MTAIAPGWGSCRTSPWPNKQGCPEFSAGFQAPHPHGIKPVSLGMRARSLAEVCRQPGDLARRAPGIQGPRACRICSKRLALAPSSGAACFPGHCRLEKAASLTCEMSAVPVWKALSPSPQWPPNTSGEWGGGGSSWRLRELWPSLLMELAGVIHKSPRHPSADKARLPF